LFLFGIFSTLYISGTESALDAMALCDGTKPKKTQAGLHRVFLSRQ
jgi:hypothetical protein